MEKNKIVNFSNFEINKSKLDQIRGGKTIDEEVYSGSGADGRCCGPDTCVQEFMIIYTDGTWSYRYVPCD